MSGSVLMETLGEVEGLGHDICLGTVCNRNGLVSKQNVVVGTGLTEP